LEYGILHLFSFGRELKSPSTAESGDRTDVIVEERKKVSST